MSYIGVVPSEATTGQNRRLGAITKTGSAHARRLLTEAAWHYRPRPNLGKTLTERQHGQPAAAVAIAWKASSGCIAPDPAGGAQQAAHADRGRRRPRTGRILLDDHPDRMT